MRDDLLDAQAAIDWAVAQIQVLQTRIVTWRRDDPYVPIFEPDTSNPRQEILKAKLVKPLPRVIHAETGAILHMIRSSLDILAVTLAVRNGFKGSKRTYFPIAETREGFYIGQNGMKPATEKIKQLSDPDKATIDQLRPYKGGNDLLFSLHQLDLIRKHRHLIGATILPKSITLVRRGAGHDAAGIIYNGGSLEDGTPLARVAAGTQGNVHFTLEVSFSETPFAERKPVISTLREFASAAQDIIALFDRP